jgi:putative phosphoesterase
MITLGIISDSHLQTADLDPPTPMVVRTKKLCDRAFKSVNRIIHAGDVVQTSVLSFFEQYAPVAVVRGNGDHGPGIDAWPVNLTLEFEQVRVSVAHDRKDLFPIMKKYPTGPHLFIFGHSHEAYFEEFDPGRAWLNPGSTKRPAGEDRRPSVALVHISGDQFSVEFVKSE